MVKKRLISKISYFEKAIKTLQAILLQTDKTESDDEYFIFFRDSLIQRFEYCIDMFWKMLREFIIEQHGVDVSASPKAVLKQAMDLYIIDEEQYKTLVASVNDRNLTSHAYHEEIAKQISSHIQSYYELMKKIAQKLKQEL